MPYGLTLTVEIRDTKMTQIESPSHAIHTTPHAHGTTVTLASDQADATSPSVALDRDFVLLMRPEEVYQPVAHVTREADGTLCAMVTLHPEPRGIPSRGNEVAHVVGRVLGLWLERGIEQACGNTWRIMRADRDQRKLAPLLSLHGEVWQVTAPSPVASTP